MAFQEYCRLRGISMLKLGEEADKQLGFDVFGGRLLTDGGFLFGFVLGVICTTIIASF